MQAPHERLAHPCHAQHMEAPSFQLVQDYARRVIDVVLTTVNRRRRGGSMRGCMAQALRTKPVSAKNQA